MRYKNIPVNDIEREIENNLKQVHVLSLLWIVCGSNLKIIFVWVGEWGRGSLS